MQRGAAGPGPELECTSGPITGSSWVGRKFKFAGWGMKTVEADREIMMEGDYAVPESSPTGSHRHKKTEAPQSRCLLPDGVRFPNEAAKAPGARPIS
jgi:hypothetical protein